MKQNIFHAFTFQMEMDKSNIKLHRPDNKLDI